MTDKDFEVICSKIDDEKEFLNSVSQDLWKNPELCYNEVHAHELLTSSLEKHGFQVQKKYFISTAFRASYTNNSGKGPTVAILLEYDALAEIGHACGHNLIAEAGLAASLAVKAAMERDPSVAGKLVVLGTPAEEGGGGKIKLGNFGAFADIDVAMMVHPCNFNRLYPNFLCSQKFLIEFKGKEAHAAAYPWNGINALDAAVICYQNIALLRQQTKPTTRINVLIRKSGSAINVIPAESSLEILIRAPTSADTKTLLSKIEGCIKSAAEATGCETKYSFDENGYQNLITNKVLINIFQTQLERLGITPEVSLPFEPVASTDMGNVSHLVPSIHPLYAIPTEASNHTKQFAIAAGAVTAQDSTLAMGKAMAMTALHVMRAPDLLKAVKKQFEIDLQED